MLLTYRLYCGDGEHREFDAPNDERALALVDSSLAEGPAELWCRNRLVHRWQPSPLPLFDWRGDVRS